MSEWNYTQCAKPFETVEQAREYMVSRNFAGQILLRNHGGYTAVCPTYPEGYYPDAISVEAITIDELPASEEVSHLVEPGEDSAECCAPGPVSVELTNRTG